MFFKKSEPKRWHPCLVLTVGALSIVGAITITNAAKCALNNMKSKMKAFFSPKADADPESPFPGRSSLTPEEY